MNTTANSLEELEQIPKQVIGGLAKLPGSIVAGGIKKILGRIDPLTGLEIPTPQRVQQLQKREKKQRQSGLAMMRQTLAVSQKAQTPQNSQIPQYIVGKPRFNQDKMIKRMQGLETEKRELPPPVSAVKQKFSTGERKHGVGG